MKYTHSILVMISVVLCISGCGHRISGQTIFVHAFVPQEYNAGSYKYYTIVTGDSIRMAVVFTSPLSKSTIDTKYVSSISDDSELCYQEASGGHIGYCLSRNLNGDSYVLTNADNEIIHRFNIIDGSVIVVHSMENDKVQIFKDVFDVRVASSSSSDLYVISSLLNADPTVCWEMRENMMNQELKRWILAHQSAVMELSTIGVLINSNKTQLLHLANEYIILIDNDISNGDELKIYQIFANGAFPFKVRICRP